MLVEGCLSTARRAFPDRPPSASLTSWGLIESSWMRPLSLWISLCLTILSHFSVGLCDKSQSPSQWLWSCKSYLWSSQCKSEFKPYQPKADKQSQNVTCLPMSVTWGQMNLVLMWLFSVGSKELYERACSETNKIFQIKIFQNSCI